MATIRRFEDLEIWQLSRKQAKEIYELTQDMKWNREFDLKNQIIRSSGSVPDNISEGFERESRKEFIHFLTISKGSNGEVQSQIYRAFDRKYIDENQYNYFLAKSKEIGVKTKRFIQYVQSSELKGQKFGNQDTEEKKE